MADQKPPPEDALSNLRRRVNAARKDEESSSSGPPDSAAGLALKFGGEFGAAVLVGALLGYGADHYLHTDPWGMVLGLGFGFAAGVVNVVRLARAYSSSHPVDPSAPKAPDDES